jgi:hypothetical protein
MSGPKIMRYGAHLHREWLQVQHELEAMQTRPPRWHVAPRPPRHHRPSRRLINHQPTSH